SSSRAEVDDSSTPVMSPSEWSCLAASSRLGCHLMTMREGWKHLRQSATTVDNVVHDTAFGVKIPITGAGRRNRVASNGADSPSTPENTTAPPIGPRRSRASTAAGPSSTDREKSSLGEN